jgi:hypothetical protein
LTVSSAVRFIAAGILAVAFNVEPNAHRRSQELPQPWPESAARQIQNLPAAFAFIARETFFMLLACQT